VVEPSGARRWVQRVTINGERRDRGLGSLSVASLEDARDESLKIRRAARQGCDHIADEEEREARMVTFRQAFETMFELRKEQLSNAKHLNQWSPTMETYVFPRIGDKLVAEVTSADVIAILGRSGSRRRRPPGACCSAWRRCSNRHTCLSRGRRSRAAMASESSWASNTSTSSTSPALPRCSQIHRDPPCLALAPSDQAGVRVANPHCHALRRDEGRQVGRDRREGCPLDDPQGAHEGGEAKRRPHVVPLPKRCLQIRRDRSAVQGAHPPGGERSADKRDAGRRADRRADRSLPRCGPAQGLVPPERGPSVCCGILPERQPQVLPRGGLDAWMAKRANQNNSDEAA
jgi:hypothetical protein